MSKELLKIFQQLKKNSSNNTTTNSIQSSHDHQKSDSLMRFPVTTSTIFSSPGEIEFLRRNHKNNQVKCQNIFFSDLSFTALPTSACDEVYKKIIVFEFIVFFTNTFLIYDRFYCSQVRLLFYINQVLKINKSP